MGRILHWFYCLPMGQAAVLMVLAALAFRWMDFRWRKYPLFTGLTAAVFALWVGAVAYTTLGNRESGEQYRVSLELFHSYRELLSGGNKEILRSNFMNGALFFPGGVLMGALVPRRWPLRAKVLMGTVILGAFSVGVEYMQYAFALGRVEADDVFHNTLGALLGLLAGTLGGSFESLASQRSDTKEIR